MVIVLNPYYLIFIEEILFNIIEFGEKMVINVTLPFEHKTEK